MKFGRIRPVLVAAFLFVCLTTRGEEPVTLKMGGIQMALPQGWERLNQPTNFLIQQRARNPDQGIAISAGAFQLGLSVQQYVAIGIAGLQSFDESIFQKLADTVGVPVHEVERVLKSRLGQQLMQQTKAASTTAKLDYIGSSKTRIAGKQGFEIHSKMTILSSGQEIFSRQFTLAGSAPQVIVQVTFASASKDIFEDKSLPSLIQKEIP